MMRFFVVMAARSVKSTGDVMLVTANTTKAAHHGCAVDFRRKHSLASSVHVHTVTLYDADTEDEARAFLDRLEVAYEAQPYGEREERS